MKPSEAIVVFMRIPESAGLGNGPTIIEVFDKKDRSDAEALVSQIKEKVIKNWTQKKVSEEELERIKELAEDVAKIITLEDAIQEIEEEIHDMYQSMDEDY